MAYEHVWFMNDIVRQRVLREPGMNFTFIFVLDSMVSCMTFANEHDGGQMVTLNEQNREKVTPLKSNGQPMLWKNVKETICKIERMGLIRKVAKETYQVNPYYAYKGYGKLMEYVQLLWDRKYGGNCLDFTSGKNKEREGI